MFNVSRGIKRIALIIFILSLGVTICFSVLVFFVYRGINFESDERLFESAKCFDSTTFYAYERNDDGSYEAVTIETSGGLRKTFYSLDEISEYLKSGFVAVEDRRFYDHNGINVRRTILAAINYITKKDRIFGASTITQQVVKNISGDNQLSIKRKLEEIIRAIHIEQSYSKEEILEVYLNVIPMSEGIYGVGAASMAYFGKHPKDLSPEEAATLIGITNAPTAYNPYIHPEACLKKRNIIIGVMKEMRIISDESYTNAIDSELNLLPREAREDKFDSWFVETSIEEIASDLQGRYNLSSSAARMMLLGGGYKVYTTMNISVQKILEEYFENIDNLPTEVENGLNYAMVVTDRETGHLAGIIGRAGKKEGNRLLNHATVAHIPGSTLKPIALYAPLIDEGKINWATVFDDVPVEFLEENDDYRPYPRNSPDVYDGLTTVKDAIRKSKNTVAIRLCKIRTPRSVFNSLRDDFGFNTLVEREGNKTDISYAPMALGQLCKGVSLLKLTEAYSSLSGDGIWREATTYTKVVDYKGRVILENSGEEKQIYKNSTARIMTQLLKTVTESGTASSLKLKNIVDTAGKTGTSGGSRDKEFIGYTPYFTAGIWCGFDGSDKAIPSLSKSHLEIWDEIMTKMHSEIIQGGDLKSFSTEGLYRLPYCMDSGNLYSDSCILDPRGNRLDYGYFTADNCPEDLCKRHVVCKYDSLTKAVACPGCPKENLVDVALLYIPERSFPKQITVIDAEYVYRDVGRYDPRPDSYDLPYFQFCLPDGVYVGKGKGTKQFNSNCYLHDE